MLKTKTFLLPLSLIVASGCALVGNDSKVEKKIAKVNFNKDIRPILSDKCFHCHGPDEEERKGDLRLDIPDGPEGAFRVLDGIASIIPGNPEESEVFYRISTDDSDDIMPPKKSHKAALTAEEIALFKRWIEEGATWSKHWAFEPIKTVKVPEVDDQDKVENPIDNFILSRLEQEGLEASDEASKEKLIRRLSYDLNGLPPSLEEVKNLLEDDSDNSYEKVVDKFLAKPAYGERMALPWLDMARYGDSSVYHADGPRTMWPWRDWVIDAYNKNMPFDQFSIEQIAGDHLPNATTNQKVATAFLRNNGTTDEGGAFPEEYRVEYTVDRLSTVSKIWLGLTTECAQCHDHKYDPITQKEFFEMYAFFNVAADKGMQSRNGNAAPTIPIHDNPYQKKMIGELQAKLSTADKNIEKFHKDHQAAFNQWLAQNSNQLKAAPAGLKHFFPLRSREQVDNFAQLAFMEAPKNHNIRVVNGIDEKIDGKTKKPIAKTQATILRHAMYNSIPKIFDSNQASTLSFHLKYAPQKEKHTILGQAQQHNAQGLELYVNDNKLGFSYVRIPNKERLFVEAEQELLHNKWQHITVTYDGSQKASGVKMYLNGQLIKQKTIHDSLKPQFTNNHPFMIGRRHTGKNTNNPITLLQIYDRALAPNEIANLASLSYKDLAFGKNANPNFTMNLKNAFYQKNKLNFKPLLTQRHVTLKPLNDFKNLNVMIMQDQPKAQARKTYILDRGAYDQPKKDLEIFPNTPKALPTMKTNHGKNRLGFAQWIMDKDNTLTARVTVNRYWMMLFGKGLVSTSSDFGNQGSWPTHPELLDWLATDFRDNGWNVKRTIKQIVMSKTYRQDSAVTEELLKRDRQNKLYARGPRFRLAGEHIRDSALQVGGLLSPQIGGESVKPYQPSGLWNEVSLLGNVRFVQDKGEKNYRKSIYTYYKRSSPIPNMSTFDAPSREKCTIERSRTNTPLQALVTLNDPIFVEAARFFAERIIKEGGKNFDDKIHYAFKSSLAVDAEPYQVTHVKAFYKRRLAEFQKDPKLADALLSIGDSERDKTLDPAEHASWTLIAQLVLNLDENLNKE
ncbi:hypothetical protein LNTAR_22969 [Lentisphaera araneosa HTCC2155]|uniref:LamG-like jellyroll fold domain-containing protein n=1 Tax=Lentisphaera araneosa HTCC2155 TaxID=313628 RepID=A6DGI5_9BACT|nr:DUF1553 domain-containing protein [Lentisphaera araneosa]EDM29302.1 hypothetical protein LNTAR_22969 [Lentisphaera araneosa HTCC2155]